MWLFPIYDLLELLYSSFWFTSYIISIAKTAAKKIWNLDSFYEVFFSWGCSVSLQI